MFESVFVMVGPRSCQYNFQSEIRWSLEPQMSMLEYSGGEKGEVKEMLWTLAVW